ncbi:MAG: hypothetical protein AAGE01_15485 [Pseudomonadota bacterium]
MSARQSVSLALLLLSGSLAQAETGSTGRILGAQAGSAPAWTATTDADGDLRWTLDASETPRPESSQLVVDSAPPSVTWELTGPAQNGADGRTIVHPDTRFTPVVEDPAGAIIERRLVDGDPVSAWPAPLPDRVRTLTVHAADTLGNERQSDKSILVDGKGPEVSYRLLTELEGAPGYSSRPAKLAVTAVDDLTQARLLVAENTACSTRSSCELISDEAGVTLRAEDALGNRTELAVAWLYDEVPPEVSLSYAGRAIPPGELIVLSVGEAVGFELSDAGVGVRSAVYRYNDIDEKPVPSTLRFLTKGRYLLLVRSEDLIGNTGESRWTIVAR